MSDEPAQHLETRVLADHQIVRLNGNCFIDDDHIRETGSKLSQAVATADSKYFLVNLGNIAVVSSMMIGQLVNVRNKCEEANLEFQISDLRPAVEESLKIMNLHELLSVYPTEADALAASEE